MNRPAAVQLPNADVACIRPRVYGRAPEGIVWANRATAAANTPPTPGPVRERRAQKSQPVESGTAAVAMAALGSGRSSVRCIGGFQGGGGMVRWSNTGIPGNQRRRQHVRRERFSRCEQLKSWWNVCTHAKEEAGFWEI